MGRCLFFPASLSEAVGGSVEDPSCSTGMRTKYAAASLQLSLHLRLQLRGSLVLLASVSLEPRILSNARDGPRRKHTSDVDFRVSCTSSPCATWMKGNTVCHVDITCETAAAGQDCDQSRLSHLGFFPLQKGTDSDSPPLRISSRPRPIFSSSLTSRAVYLLSCVKPTSSTCSAASLHEA